MRKYKRALRNIFKLKGARTKLGADTLVGLIAVLSLIIFIGTQLTTNSILSPMGRKLQSLNLEKNQLIEVNREVEREIASSVALTVVETYAKEKFSLSGESDSETIYITEHKLQASR